MTMNGIDIASHQAGLVPSKVPGDFIIVKATQGTGYFNPYFESWAKQILECGKGLGIYHYANGAGVNAEVDWFLRNIEKYIGKATLHLDWENIPGAGPNAQFTNPTYAKQFMDEVKRRTGVTMFIYGSKDSCFNAMNWATIKQAGYYLWGAQYGSYAAVNGYSANPWQSSRPWGVWEQDIKIHQYTSNLRLIGWNGGLDGNIAYMTKAEWDAVARGKAISTIPTPKPNTNISSMTLLDLIIGVQEDKYGKNNNRKKALGNRYEEVQTAINHIYGASADILAKEVMTGKYGNDEIREKALGKRYDEVQKAVNKFKDTAVSTTDIAKEVMAGKWGNEPERTKRLRAAGYDSVAVQKEVNRLYGI